MFDVISIKGGVDNIDGFNQIIFDNNKSFFIIYCNDECDVAFINSYNFSSLLECEVSKCNFVVINSNLEVKLGEVSNDLFNLDSREFKIGLFNKIHSNIDNINILGDIFSYKEDNCYSNELTFMINLPEGSFYINAKLICNLSDRNKTKVYCVITTDSNLNKNDLEYLLKKVVLVSFNSLGICNFEYHVFLLTNNKFIFYDRDAFETSLTLMLKRLAIDLLGVESRIIALDIADTKNIDQAITYSKQVFMADLIKSDIVTFDSFIDILNHCSTLILPNEIFINGLLISSKNGICVDNKNKVEKILQSGDDYKITFKINSGSSNFCLYIS